MTPQEFLEAVRRIQSVTRPFSSVSSSFEYDPEESHVETDELMESVLTDLGYGEGVELIRSMSRWYA